MLGLDVNMAAADLLSLFALVVGTVGRTKAILVKYVRWNADYLMISGDLRHPLLRSVQSLLPPSPKLPRPTPLASLRRSENLFSNPRPPHLRRPRPAQEIRYSRTRRTKRTRFRGAPGVARYLRPAARQSAESQGSAELPGQRRRGSRPAYYFCW